MITVEARWQEYRSKVYPTVREDSEQIRQLKLAWFSSYFDCMVVIQVLSASAKNDDEGADSLQKLHDEAEGFCRDQVMEMLKDLPAMSRLHQ